MGRRIGVIDAGLVVAVADGVVTRMDPVGTAAADVWSVMGRVAYGGSLRLRRDAIPYALRIGFTADAFLMPA